MSNVTVWQNYFNITVETAGVVGDASVYRVMLNGEEIGRVNCDAQAEKAHDEMAKWRHRRTQISGACPNLMSAVGAILAAQMK